VLVQLIFHRINPLFSFVTSIEYVGFSSFSKISPLSHGFNTSLIKKDEDSCIKTGGNLENWFLGDDEKIEKFLHESCRKAITFNWLKGQNLIKVRKVLKE